MFWGWLFLEIIIIIIIITDNKINYKIIVIFQWWMCKILFSNLQL